MSGYNWRIGVVLGAEWVERKGRVQSPHVEGT